MNTPTPAQALGECLSVIAPMIGKKQFTVTKYDDGTSALEGDNDYMVAVCMSLELVIKHGQHFAGLEKENESARETLAKALDADDVNDEPLCKLAIRASNALYWRSAETQEYRAKAEAAEARVRETEGLLRLWAGSLKPHKVPIQVAAFLAASWVTPTSGQSS